MIGIRVLTQFGKQSDINSTCFDEVEDSYDYC